MLPKKNPWQQMVLPELGQVVCVFTSLIKYTTHLLCSPPTPTLALTGGRGWWSNWKSMYQFYSNKRENTRGQKSTNLPKLAKCLEWEQGRGEMADFSQRWAGPDGHHRIPARERGEREIERARQRGTESETRWLFVCVTVLNADKWD